MSGYNDTEIITHIKNGHKEVLIPLYKSLETAIKKSLADLGASEEDLHALVEDVLVLLWVQVQTGHFVLNEGLKIQLPKMALSLWEKRLVRQELEGEDQYVRPEEKIKKYLAANSSTKYVSYNRGKVGVSVPLFALASIAVVWLVLEYKPVEIRTIAKLIKIPSYIYFNRNNDSDSTPLAAVAGPVIPANHIAVAQTSENDSVFNPDSSSVSRAASDGIVYAGGEGLLNDTMKEEEIVVKKDVLVAVQNMKVLDKSPSNTFETDEKPLVKELTEKMNPEAKVPDFDAKEGRSYQVEFWKSPVNFKGYKMSRNKLVLFGLEASDQVKMFLLNESFYLHYHNTLFKLEETDAFEPFTKVKDTGLFTGLK
jgi:hypothetical protein